MRNSVSVLRQTQKSQNTRIHRHRKFERKVRPSDDRPHAWWEARHEIGTAGAVRGIAVAFTRLGIVRR